MQSFISIDAHGSRQSKAALAFGTALLLLGLAFFDVGCDSTAQRRLDHIRNLEQQGDLLNALGELRAILLETPDQPEANYRLGRYLVQGGERARAVWPLERAFQSPEFQQPAGEYLLSVYLDDDNPQQVLRIANTLLIEKPDLPSALLARGHAYLELDQGELALRDARSISRDNPANLQATLLEAKALWKLGQLDAALQRYRSVRQSALDRGETERAIRTWIEIGDLQHDRAQRDVHHPEDEAEESFQKLLEAYPVHPLALGAVHAYFDAIERSGRFLEILKRIAEQEPYQLDVQLNYAQALLETGDFAEALAVLDKTISRIEKNARLYVFKGRIEQQTGKLNEAKISYEQALGQDPEFSPALTGLALLALDRGDLEQALKRLEQAQTKAQNGDPFFIAAGILQQLGRHEQAIKALRQAIAKTPTDNRAFNNLAWELAEHGGDLDEALHLARLSARLSRDAEVLDTLGWVHWKRGEILPAKSNFEASLRKRESPSVRYHLGLVLEKLGAPLAARIQFEKALESETPFSEAEQAKSAMARLPAI